MKRLIILSLLIFQSFYGSPSLDAYFSYLEKIDKPNGSHLAGEIEVVTDLEEISQIQKVQESRLLKKGFSEDEAREFSRIGVVSEDHYWIWLRDAVYFPNKVPGTYDRMLWKSDLERRSPGVAVLPILPSGKIGLILNYRHATRSWELEIPRGGMKLEESPEEAALRELREETGLIATSVDFLGEMAPDSGVSSALIPLFLGKTSLQEESTPEYSEAIAGILSFTKEELKEGLAQGFLEVPVRGELKRVPIRDPFLTFALLQAEHRQWL